MRLEGWEDRMLEVVQHHTALPFEWGVSDCARLPMDVCEALVGARPDLYVDDYHSASEAVRRLKERGFRNLGEAFARAFVEGPPAMAHRGDIGLAEYPGAILGGGVVVLGETLLGKGEEGVVRLPRSALLRAFRVGW